MKYFIQRIIFLFFIIVTITVEILTKFYNSEIPGIATPPFLKFKIGENVRDLGFRNCNH